MDKGARKRKRMNTKQILINLLLLEPLKKIEREREIERGSIKYIKIENYSKLIWDKKRNKQKVKDIFFLYANVRCANRYKETKRLIRFLKRIKRENIIIISAENSASIICAMKTIHQE